MASLDLSERDLDMLATGMAWFVLEAARFLPAEPGGETVLADLVELADRVAVAAGTSLEAAAGEWRGYSGKVV